VNEETADVPVPACPGWSVKDVLAHLAGFFTTYRTGKDGFGPGWADQEVAARRDRTIVEIQDEWAALVESSDDLFESQLGPVAVSDVLAHEQDIRTALDQPGARDDENIVPAVEMALSFAEKKAADAELGTLRIITDDIDRSVGGGAPEATLRTGTFELFRTVHGRRTVEQVQTLDWDGDPRPWLPTLFIFGPTEQKVEEPSQS
jgi:uncharacterized protein (TIGR03083 family)